MRGALPVLVAALLVAGCGGDDDDAAEPGGAVGASGAAGVAAELTAGEFLAELRPQKENLLSAYVAESESCAGVPVEPSFVLLVSAAAAEVSPETPLAELVEEQCADG